MDRQILLSFLLATFTDHIPDASPYTLIDVKLLCPSLTPAEPLILSCCYSYSPYSKEYRDEWQMERGGACTHEMAEGAKGEGEGGGSRADKEKA